MCKWMVLMAVVLISACVNEPEAEQAPVAWSICQQNEQSVQAQWAAYFDEQSIEGDAVTIVETSSESSQGQRRYELVANLNTSRDFDVTGQLVLKGTSREQISEATLSINDSNGATISSRAVMFDLMDVGHDHMTVELLLSDAVRQNAIGQSHAIEQMRFELDMRQVSFEGGCRPDA